MNTPTVPTNPQAGPAQSVIVVTDAESQGGPALPVYGWTGQPSDGRSVVGKRMRVKVITAADLRINGGAYWLEGRPFALPVSSLATGESTQEGNIAVAVYIVGGAL